MLLMNMEKEETIEGMELANQKNIKMPNGKKKKPAST